ESSCKNGRMNGKQRYRCRSCGYNYTGGVGTGYPVEQRQVALKLYLEGLGFRAIGRVLDVSNVTVMRWVRAYGQRAQQQAADAPAQAVRIAEVDELHSYVQRKKTPAGSGSR
ncbi:helix-turn-helix domain-containing protein, partial [Hymenobacter coalescens]